MPNFTLIVPYYRNCEMLKRQLVEWENYPRNVKIILVDDGSPEPAEDILANSALSVRERIELYRVTVDIPWNREGARNLGAERCNTDWLVHIDIDHVLPATSAIALERFKAKSNQWYRFPRFRQGRADETRMKDDLPRDAKFGEIKPHIDSYLIERGVYWSVGGYNEDFAGCLGGGTEFLKRLEARSGAPKLLPESIPLHVYTRDLIRDASDWSLSRDRTEGKRRARGVGLALDPIRFPWVRIQ